MRTCATTWEAEMSPAEQQFLRDLLTRERLAGTHLEIGTAAGGILCHLMRCYDDSARPKFAVVDPMTYFDDQVQIVRGNLEKHGLSTDDVDFRTMTSRQAFDDASRRGETYDFILIDASHRVVSVMADLRWTRLLSAEGIVCLHDYQAKFPGVQMSVDRFLTRNSNYEVIGCADSLIAIRKRMAGRREIQPLDHAYSLWLYLPLELHRKVHKWRLRPAGCLVQLFQRNVVGPLSPNRSARTNPMPFSVWQPLCFHQSSAISRVQLLASSQSSKACRN